MCGIAGLFAGPGMPSHMHMLLVRDAISMRDALSHRGPDDAGLWADHSDFGSVVLAHRRLIVRGTTCDGSQPVRSSRSAIVYNGELYNQSEVHRSFDAHSMSDVCDSATVHRALDAHGVSALHSFRGMYAIGYYDLRSHTLTLARDPMGIKPLYWTVLDRHGEKVVAFASEIASLLALPHVKRQPDLVTLSSYLTTIRTTLGERTLYDGVYAVRPGQVLTFRFTHGKLCIDRACIELDDVLPNANLTCQPCSTFEETVDRTRSVVEQSVRAHLSSDVPVCSMLSGGLDSSILASILRSQLREHGSLGASTTLLATWCAASDQAEADDLQYARLVAGHLGTDHHEVIVTQAVFLQRWAAMVAGTGVPMSTPNEVAIAEVARDMNQRGFVVALSGEGADELFGGYDEPLSVLSSAFDRGAAVDDEAELEFLAWVPTQLKSMLMTDSAWRYAACDVELRSDIRLFIAASREKHMQRHPAGSQREARLKAHLDYSRASNLVGLLQRLDASLMGYSIEGRTPFADVAVAQLAGSLTISDRFTMGTSEQVHTKRVLRAAFADVLPACVVNRPKRSFPLPFRQWIVPAAIVLEQSTVIRSWIKPEIVDAIAQQPAQHWRLAWPIMNLAIWAEHMFGDARITEQLEFGEMTTAYP